MKWIYYILRKYFNRPRVGDVVTWRYDIIVPGMAFEVGYKGVVVATNYGEARYSTVTHKYDYMEIALLNSSGNLQWVNRVHFKIV